MKKGRGEAARRPRRIIYRNDAGDGVLRAVTAQDFLARRTSGLELSFVGAIFYAAPFDDAVAPAPVGDARDDALRALIRFGRTHELKIFWSVCMNDPRDTGPGEDGRPLNRWKRENRDVLMASSRASFPFGWIERPSEAWSAMDYAKASAREHIHDVVRDAAARYDLDGIELDFCRRPVFFRPQLAGEPVAQRHADRMSELVRRIRVTAAERAAGRGRPLRLAVRVFESLEFNRRLGLDVARWLAEDLVDLVVAGGDFRLGSWSEMAGACAEHDTPLYACLSRAQLPGDDEAWRQEALWAWEEGVRGICTDGLHDPNAKLLKEIGDARRLRARPRADRYALDRGGWLRAQRPGTVLRGGEDLFDPGFAARWLPPVPPVRGGAHVGFEPDVGPVLTDERHKLSFHVRSGAYRLHDLLNDPTEKRDIQADQPQRFARMRSELESWLNENAAILHDNAE